MAASTSPNRKCLVCGNDYYFCACQSRDNRFSWKQNCDTPLHFQIFLTAIDLRDGVIGAEEAKRRLAALKFFKKDLSWLTPETADILKRAFETRKEQEIEEGE